MKKFTLLLNVFCCLAFVGSLRAQTFVSTTPSNRNVVLEEYTGVECSGCPLGNKSATALAAKNPGRVVVIAIHQGSLANTIPDYRTIWGDMLGAQAGVKSWPSGIINRHLFKGDLMQLGSDDWAIYAPQILNEQSCVNVAAQSTIDWKTRKLTVTVEAYYTGNSNKPTNMLNVAILQDNILGEQKRGGTYPEMMLGGLYRHNHMLRHLITGYWGDTIHTTTQGSFFTKTYTYNIPPDYRKVPVEMEDLIIAVSVAEGKDEIITGTFSSIKHEYLDEVNMSLKNLYELEKKNTCDNYIDAGAVVFNNSLHNIESYTLKYGVGNTDSIYNVTGKNIAAGKTDTILFPPMFIISNKENNITVAIATANDVDLVSTGRQRTIVVSKDTVITVRNSLTVNVWQDQYGSETSWKLFNSSGQVIDSDGPYTNLETRTTQLNTKETPLLDPDCYYFRIYDKYGDGFNNGSGAGKYEILAGDRLLHSSNAKFKLDETKYIRIDESTGVNIVENLTESWQIYPNPVNDKMTISFSLNNSGNIAVSVCDILGREIITKDEMLYTEGNHTVEINTQQLRAGGYIVKLQTADGVVCKKILVKK